MSTPLSERTNIPQATMEPKPLSGMGEPTEPFDMLLGRPVGASGMNDIPENYDLPVQSTKTWPLLSYGAAPNAEHVVALETDQSQRKRRTRSNRGKALAVVTPEGSASGPLEPLAGIPTPCRNALLPRQPKITVPIAAPITAPIAAPPGLPEPDCMPCRTFAPEEDVNQTPEMCDMACQTDGPACRACGAAFGCGGACPWKREDLLRMRQTMLKEDAHAGPSSLRTLKIPEAV